MPETPVTSVKCPYTGEPVEIREIVMQAPMGSGYMGVVNSKIGGYTTRIFTDKRLLLDFLRHRGGVLKGKPLYPKIEVRERESKTSADLTAEENQRERDLDATSEKTADAILRAAHDRLVK